MKDCGLKAFVRGAMSFYFHADTHILLTHSGVFPLYIRPEKCISTYPHYPQAFENVEVKFRQYHCSSMTLMLLMLWLDEAVVGESNPPGGFCTPVLQNDDQMATMGGKKQCFETLSTVYFWKDSKKNPCRDREILHKPSPLQPTLPSVLRWSVIVRLGYTGLWFHRAASQCKPFGIPFLCCDEMSKMDCVLVWS